MKPFILIWFIWQYTARLWNEISRDHSPYLLDDRSSGQRGPVKKVWQYFHYKFLFFSSRNDLAQGSQTLETPIFPADCSPSLLLSNQEEDECPASRRLVLSCRRGRAWSRVHFISTPLMDLSWIDLVQSLLSPFPFFSTVLRIPLQRRQVSIQKAARGWDNRRQTRRGLRGGPAWRLLQVFQ